MSGLNWRQAAGGQMYCMYDGKRRTGWYCIERVTRATLPWAGAFYWVGVNDLGDATPRARTFDEAKAALEQAYLEEAAA